MTTPRPLNVLFATPECAPWVKTGGLGDVCGALPTALRALGHDVRVLIPAFPAMAGLAAEAERVIELPAQGPWPAARLLLTHGRGLPLWLLDCPALFQRPCGPYVDALGLDFADNAERFGFLSHVAARMSLPGGPCPDWPVHVLHCHDWTTALAPAYLHRHVGPRAGTVLTIHNLLFQGMFPSQLADRLDMSATWLTVEQGLLHWDRLCFLKGGIRFADKVTTVSPTYAREILGEREGCGLDGMLRLRAGDLVGILNGIDTSVWNPGADPLIPAPYEPATLHLKAVNKRALQERMGLSVEPDAMVLGLVSRLTPQKGIDMVMQALPAWMDMGCQVVVLGSGDATFETGMSQLASAHAGRVAVRIGFDESLAHLIEAGSDAFLMPSLFEPCGLSQMYSHAYGTPPIVHTVGGLADTVLDDDEEPGTGDGFTFASPTLEAFCMAVQRAHTAYIDKGRWRGIQQRAMARDHGWEASARRYEALYRSVAARDAG